MAIQTYKEVLSIERECKHSIRYKSTDDNNGIGTIYVPKILLYKLTGNTEPKKIELTLRALE